MERQRAPLLERLREPQQLLRMLLQRRCLGNIKLPTKLGLRSAAAT